MKATRDRKRLFDDGITWVEDFPAWAVKAIGVLEALAAVGLILPCGHGDRTRADALGRGRHRSC